MKTSTEVVSAAIYVALTTGARAASVMAGDVVAALQAEGFAIVPVVPTVEMVATVVQMTGDPSPEAWALAERAVGGMLGLPNMAGEQACAELVRDWQNMIEATGAGQ